jgi:hypothetical protein
MKSVQLTLSPVTRVKIVRFSTKNKVQSRNPGRLLLKNYITNPHKYKGSAKTKAMDGNPQLSFERKPIGMRGELT